MVGRQQVDTTKGMVVSCDGHAKRGKALTVVLAISILAVMLSGCAAKTKVPARAPQAMPVGVSTVALSPVPTTDTYVATIKSRRSSTMQPQVSGNLTKILVHSGQLVKAGQLLMQVDPLKQVATVESQQGTQAQKLAVYKYNQGEVERQKKLFEAGVTSKQAYDQAEQAYQNAKADYDSSVALTRTQQQQLDYYQVRAPFAGVVGDIPVHLGDYVTPTTVLTTVDENADLEAYIYVPTDKASEVHMGLPVDILDSQGKTLVQSKVDFISPEVDNGLQGILLKADIPRTAVELRNLQLVNARLTWSTNARATVPVLAVVRVGGQPFIYVAAPTPQGGYVAHQVAVTLGDTFGNSYPVLSGLKLGDKVILSGIQFLQEGVPVKPMG